MKIYAEINKTEELDDGTIKVWGYASSGAEDSDGETITPDAMKAALPDYMKFGAVREMHQPKAAGTAIEAQVLDDGRTFFGAHVVDAEAVKKVKAGVYKGFSIGGKVTERDELNKAIIKGLKLVEVSLVDRPANPEAVLTCYKAETLDEEQRTVQENQDKTEPPDKQFDGVVKHEPPQANKIDSDALNKVLNEIDLLKGDLLKIRTERDDLEKRVKELEAKPQPPKAVLKAVAKEGDAVGVVEKSNLITPVTNADGNQNEIATLIKSIHQNTFTK